MRQTTEGRVRRGTTRRTIMDAATHLFATRGVTNTSVDDIAESAGSAKGSVYYNFASKSGLVEALIAEHTTRVAAEIQQACDGRSGVPLQRAVVALLLREVQEHPDAARVMVAETFRTERTWQESIAGWRDAMMEPLARDLERGSGHGLNGRIAAASIVGATLTAGLEWLLFYPELSYDYVLEQLYTVLHLTDA